MNCKLAEQEQLAAQGVPGRQVHFKPTGKTLRRYEMLLDLVWHEDYSYYSRKAINNHISNLRKKLRVAPGLPDYVKSVYGVGYKFDV